MSCMPFVWPYTSSKLATVVPVVPSHTEMTPDSVTTAVAHDNDTIPLPPIGVNKRELQETNPQDLPRYSRKAIAYALSVV